MSGRDTDTVIELLARPGERAMMPPDRRAASLGDRSVFTHDLYLEGEQIGFDGGVTTVVKIADGLPHILCVVSMSLPGGELCFQTFMEEHFPPPPFWTAVTGGTGIYARARGEMHIDPASPDRHFYTLHLRGVAAAKVAVA